MERTCHHRLAVRMMEVLFFWHCQHKSDRGFMTTIDGASVPEIVEMAA